MSKTIKNPIHVRPTLDECIFKFKNGMGLTDDELAILLQHYRDLAEILKKTNEPSYQLVLDDVTNSLNILERFKWNRDNK